MLRKPTYPPTGYVNPGGYSQQGFAMLVEYSMRTQGSERPSSKITAPAAQIARSHNSWCQELSPLLTRSLELFCAGDMDAWQAVNSDIQHKLQVGPKFLQVPASAMPPMAKALQTGWFDATFPDASDLSSDLMFDPEALAAVAAFRMATGDWSQGFKVLRRGLSAGYPDARAYQQPYAAYVEYALTQHKHSLGSGQDANNWAERLQEPFVLQAFNVRIAAVDESLYLELSTFAEPIARFTWQHRRVDLLWRITQVVCDSAVALLAVKHALQQGHFKGSRIATWFMRNAFSEASSPKAWHAAYSALKASESSPSTVTEVRLAARLAAKCPFPSTREQVLATSCELQPQGSAVFQSTLTGPVCCGLLEAAGRAYGTCPHTASSAAKDSKKSAAEPDSVPAPSSTAACIASSKDSEGRLHLATVVNSLFEMHATELWVLTEAAWKAVWDLHATQGFDRQLAFLMELTTEAGEGPPQTYPSKTPCLPTVTAFHKLMSNTLRDAQWQTAALLALWCASSYQQAAQQGLTAALAGARKRKQELELKAAVPAGEPSYEEQLPSVLTPANESVLTGAAALILLKALDCSQPDEAGLASNLMMDYNPGALTSEVRQAFLTGICTATDMYAVLWGLRTYSQYADQQPQLYSAVLQRLASTPDIAAVMDRSVTESVESRRLISALIAAFSETRTEAMAATIWALFEQACKHRHQLSPEAQHKLWLSQSGDSALQLYRHSKLQALPLCGTPPAAKLAEVAQLSLQRQDWDTALAAAQDMAAAKPRAAAQIVTDLMDGIQTQGGSISAFAAGMTLLHAAHQHEDTVRLFGLLEAQSAELLQPGHLHMAFLAALHMGDATAACDAATRHAPLAAAWTAHQQGHAFNSTLRLLQQQPSADAATHAALQVWLLAVSNNLPDKQQQLHDLLMALLSKGRLPEAHQVLQTANTHAALQPEAVDPVLAASLKKDAGSSTPGMTARSRDLLAMLKQAAGVQWPTSFAPATASLLAQALLQEPGQPDVTCLFEARTTASLKVACETDVSFSNTKSANLLLVVVQEVPQALWEAACTAYQHSEDQGGLSQAWHWMLQQQGGPWAPSDPACYISVAHAVTAQGLPLEGARMLTSYREEAYALPLSVSDCNTFLKLCKASEQAGGSLADSLSPALSLLHHMKQTSLPAPAVTTCTLATHCLLAQLTDGVPAHQVLVQLQQEVWHTMHKVTEAGAHESAAYLPALSAFDGTEAVQTVLLMVQNGISGLSGDACLALVLVMENDQLAWMRQVFGLGFMDELETMAESASQSATPSESAWLGFPDCPVPRLSVVQLTADTAYFEVAGGVTPLWMVPMAAWQHGQMSIKSVVEQLQPLSEKVAELTAAQQLAADYGHLERGSKSKILAPVEQQRKFGVHGGGTVSLICLD
ncbi:hypothetical protein ABBQ38_008796 [Trebouxia sp. C0009 RCD-2024]